MKQEKKSPSSTKRQIKVYQKYIARPLCTSVIMPEIRLTGKWLQKLGFHCGQLILVEQSQKKIIITISKGVEM
jgi:toxic protein SymE